MANNIPTLDWKPPFVELETSKGKLLIELYWHSAPNTCRNFATLAKRGYYDNTPIHRIVKDKIVQAGDPTGTGKGGESIYGGFFKDEIDQYYKHKGPGVVASANAGPNLNKSQFYITLATLQQQDNKSTIFGQVQKSDFEVLQKFNQLKTDKYSFPLENVKIIKAKVLESLDEKNEEKELNDNNSNDEDDNSELKSFF